MYLRWIVAEYFFFIDTFPFFTDTKYRRHNAGPVGEASTWAGVCGEIAERVPKLLRGSRRSHQAARPQDLQEHAHLSNRQIRAMLVIKETYYIILSMRSHSKWKINLVPISTKEILFSRLIFNLFDNFLLVYTKWSRKKSLPQPIFWSYAAELKVSEDLAD